MDEQSPDNRTGAHLQAARHHLNQASMAIHATVEPAVRGLIAACGAAGFAETNPERREELAALVDGLDAQLTELARLAARAWGVTRRDWTPDQDQEGEA